MALREIWTPWSEPNRGHQVGLRCWSPCCVRRVQERWDCSAWKTESSGEILLLPAPTKCEMYNSRGRRPTWEPENRGKKTGNTKTNKQTKKTNKPQTEKYWNRFPKKFWNLHPGWGLQQPDLPVCGLRVAG